MAWLFHVYDILESIFFLRLIIYCRFLPAITRFLAFNHSKFFTFNLFFVCSFHFSFSFVTYLIFFKFCCKSRQWPLGAWSPYLHTDVLYWLIFLIPCNKISLTSAWSFFVLSFEVSSSMHPFIILFIIGSFFTWFFPSTLLRRFFISISLDALLRLL